MTHTSECLKNQTTLAEFQAAHPKACRKCGATGEVHEPATWWEPEWDESCPNCVQENHCPLCGGELEWMGDDLWRCADAGCPVHAEWKGEFFTPDWPIEPDFDCECGMDDF